jgi:predicted aspartyl protease
MSRFTARPVVVGRGLTPVLLAVIVGVAAPPVAPRVAADEVGNGSTDLGPVVMSRELLEGTPAGPAAAGLHVHANVRAAEEPAEAAPVYQALFRVDSGAAESVAPASLLEAIGIAAVGTARYERADGTVEERPFGVVRIEFMGEMREGRILFGPEDVEPTVGVIALEAIGLTLDPETSTIERLER